MGTWVAGGCNRGRFKPEWDMVPPADPGSDRRLQGRVPFVRRCALRFADGRTGSALLVNINTVGAYVAHDDLGPGGAEPEIAPKVGDVVSCRFGLPEREGEVDLMAMVTWVNARQAHPVHSLPPGFGLTFREVPADAYAAIEDLMSDATRRSSLV